MARNEDSIVVQFTKDNIEKVGLLKFDFLGLRTLTVIQDTVNMVKANKGLKLTLIAWISPILEFVNDLSLAILLVSSSWKAPA